MAGLEWPADLGHGTFTGRFGFMDADGPDPDRNPDLSSATGGTVRITPSVQRVRYANGPLVLVARSATGVIDSEGHLCTPLADGKTPGPRGMVFPATDDEDLNPTDWSYEVQISLNGGVKIPPFNVQLPTGETVDLAVAAPVPASGGTAKVIDTTTAERAEAAAAAAEAAAEDAASGGGILGAVPIFETLAEAEAWEAANPGKVALTLEAPDTDEEPPTPGTLAVSPTDITANLTVTGASDNRAITGYAFRRGTGAWSDWQVGNTYTATGLTPATEYSFQHKVRDGAGNEALGVAVTATTATMSPKAPAEIGALWGHWDTSADGALTTAGTAVSEWVDVTSNARKQVQATAERQPALVTMNGLPAVKFDRAAQDYMRYQSTFTIDSTVGYTMCWVGRFDEAAATDQTVVSFSGALTAYRRGSDGLIITGRPGTAGPIAVKPSAGQVVMIAVVARSGGESFTWVSGERGNGVTTTLASPSTAMDLGRNTDISAYASITMGEVWVHERALSTAELDSLHMYAQQKWGAA